MGRSEQGSGEPPCTENLPDCREKASSGTRTDWIQCKGWVEVIVVQQQYEGTIAMTKTMTMLQDLRHRVGMQEGRHILPDSRLRGAIKLCGSHCVLPNLSRNPLNQAPPISPKL